MTYWIRSPLAACLLFAASARGADVPSVEETCQRVREVKVPEADKPDEATREALKGCNSEALYYGLGVKADPVRARQCALLEMASSEASGNEYAFFGQNILIMIYANGVGAKRDLEVALALACVSDPDSHGPLNDERVRHLAALKAQGWQGTDFDYCADTQSTAERAHCSSHEHRVANQRRQQMMEQFERTLRAPVRPALQALLKARDVFIEARSAKEIELAGSAYVLFKNEEASTRLEEFMALLERLERGQDPRAEPKGCEGVEAALRAAHQELLEQLPVEDREHTGIVTKTDSRETQAAWLAYRNAWKGFARLRYPSVSPDTLGCALAQARIAMLREF